MYHPGLLERTTSVLCSFLQQRGEEEEARSKSGKLREEEARSSHSHLQLDFLARHPNQLSSSSPTSQPTDISFSESVLIDSSEEIHISTRNQGMVKGARDRTALRQASCSPWLLDFSTSRASLKVEQCMGLASSQHFASGSESFSNRTNDLRLRAQHE